MLRWFLILSIVCFAQVSIAEIQVVPNDNSLQINIDGHPFTTYVFKDSVIPRPFFHSIFTSGGIPVTRNFPPVEGVDSMDHATFHPGLWLAFGDISGNDFWRNKCQVIHQRFLKSPEVKDNTASFTVLNHYKNKDQVICEEECTIRIIPDKTGVLLLWDSVFYSDSHPFYFGDQEEMGLGVRMATPFTVKNGGTILNSNNQRNESEVWGKQAEWCTYFKSIENGQDAGILLMPSPDNFRTSWFHARDYGLLTANPFGRNAFTKQEKSKIVVNTKEHFPLRFGVYIFQKADATPSFFQSIFKTYVEKSNPGTTP